MTDYAEGIGGVPADKNVYAQKGGKGQRAVAGRKPAKIKVKTTIKKAPGMKTGR